MGDAISQTKREDAMNETHALSIHVMPTMAILLATAAKTPAETVYQNDFTERRSASPVAGATSAGYAVTGLVTNRVEADVYLLDSVSNLTPPATGTHATKQPTGLDGWRRTGYNTDLGTMEAGVRKDGDTTYLRFGGGENTFAFFTHALGSAPTSGKVRLSADARLSTSWGQSGIVWVTLGDDDYYEATPGDAKNHRFTAVGIRGTANTPTFVDAGGSQNPMPDAAISAGHWYRIVVTADLDAGLASLRLYEQGEQPYPTSTTPDGTLLYSNDAITRINDVDSISSFSLGVFNKIVYFDNIKVWHIPTDSPEATILYENYFSSRTCYFQDRREDRLVGTASNPASIDGWKRLSTTTDRILLVGGANQALGFNSVGSGGSAYAAHELGGRFRNGTVATRFDLLAPNAWDSNGQLYVWLGGDRYFGGSTEDGDGTFYKWGAVGAGFSGGSFAAYSGDGAGGGDYRTSGAATPGHWYRFVMTSETSGAGKSDVAVYDMGTVQPSLATPTPSSGVVATFSALPFRRSANALGGVSCVAIQARGVKAANPLDPDASRLLVDNIAVEFTAAATVLTIR